MIVTWILAKYRMDSSMSDSYMDLNEEFINDTGSNKNEAGFKVTISRTEAYHLLKP